MIIVDCNRPESKTFLMNYIDISVWTGSKNDRALQKLANILEGIIANTQTYSQKKSKTSVNTFVT